MSESPSQSAHLGWRLVGAVYDLLPVLALWFATGAAALLLTRGQLDYHAWWYRLALLGVTAGYFVLSWRNGGQTLGMRAWRLRVVDANGQSPNWSAALLRFAISLLSLAAAGLGFLWCLGERDRRAWHDLAAGTRLVRLPKR